MAGRPGRAALVKTVAGAGGDEAVLAQIEAGRTIAVIAEELGVTRPMLSAYLNRDPDAVERLRRARETSAHVLAEEALKIADSATHADDRAKRLQVSTRQWIAGKYNRAVFGDESTAAQQGLDLGAAFVLAMRAMAQGYRQQTAMDAKLVDCELSRDATE